MRSEEWEREGEGTPLTVRREVAGFAAGRVDGGRGCLAPATAPAGRDPDPGGGAGTGAPAPAVDDDPTAPLASKSAPWVALDTPLPVPAPAADATSVATSVCRVTPVTTVSSSTASPSPNVLLPSSNAPGYVRDSWASPRSAEPSCRSSQYDTSPFRISSIMGDCSRSEWLRESRKRAARAGNLSLT